MATNFNYSIYIEINTSNFIFFWLEKNSQNNFKIIYNHEVKSIGLDNNRIFDLEKVLQLIKENIYLIEQKLN